MYKTSCTWLFAPIVYSLPKPTPQYTNENIKPYPAGYKCLPVAYLSGGDFKSMGCQVTGVVLLQLRGKVRA